MGKGDIQRRINVPVVAAIQAASTVLVEGPSSGDPIGVLGGWVFGPSSITAPGVVLHSGGYLQIGLDDRIVRLDGADPDYRLWAGAEAGPDAPFSVDRLGNLRAINAYLEGEVHALLGLVGGWTIGASDLYAGAGEERVGLRPGDWPFYAGAEEPGEAPFRVSTEGELVASAADITGAIRAVTGSLETLDITGVLTLGESGVIRSANYVTGLSGWQIDYLGNAEFQDALVRGVLDTVTFRQDTVSTVAGTLKIEPQPFTLVLLEDIEMPALGSYIDLSWPPAQPDVYEVGERVAFSDPSLNHFGILVVTLVVTGGDGSQWYRFENDGEATEGDSFSAGSLVYSADYVGNGYLLLTASQVLKGPRYSVVDTSSGAERLVAVLGNLDGAYGINGLGERVYGIGLGDYADGNYLRWEPGTGFLLRAGAGNATIDSEGVTFGPQRGMPSAVKWLNAPGKLAAYLLAYDYPENGPGQRGGNALDIQAVGTSAADEPEGTVTIEAIAFGGEPSASLQLSSGRQGTLYPGECVAGLRGDAIALWTANNAGPVHVHGSIRNSVPIHCELWRYPAQSIPNYTWQSIFWTSEQRDSWDMHGPYLFTFTGTGLNDMTVGGSFTYTSAPLAYVVEIESVGLTDAFRWSDDGGVTWDASNVAITGAAQNLNNGVTVTFGAKTGHTVGSRWSWTERPLHLIYVPEDGLYQITFSGEWAAGSAGYRFMAINAAGQYLASQRSPNMGADYVNQSVTTSCWLTTGQTIDGRVLHTNGSALDFRGASGGYVHGGRIIVHRVS